MTRKTNPNENLYLILGVMYVVLFVVIMCGLAHESTEQTVSTLLILLSLAVLGIGVYYIATLKPDGKRKTDTTENPFPYEGKRS